MSYTGQNRAKIDGIKILLVGDVFVAHLVLRAMRIKEGPWPKVVPSFAKQKLKYIICYILTIGVI